MTDENRPYELQTTHPELIKLASQEARFSSLEAQLASRDAQLAKSQEARFASLEAQLVQAHEARVVSQEAQLASQKDLLNLQQELLTRQSVSQPVSVPSSPWHTRVAVLLGILLVGGLALAAVRIKSADLEIHENPNNGPIGSPSHKVRLIGRADDGAGNPIDRAMQLQTIPSGEDYRLAIKDNAGAERVSVLNNGNVGLGRTTPSGRLHAEPAARATAFSAADGATWHDIIIRNPTSTLNAAAGIAFLLSGVDYQINAGTGIAAVKSVGSTDFGADLAFITRPQSAVSQERMRITSTGHIGIGTTDPQGALDVSSTTGAFIVPRMTTTQRDALTAVNGMIIYNATTNTFNFRENGAWVTK